jgi:asparagine synthase (glutamine-hydrolysing)
VCGIAGVFDPLDRSLRPELLCRMLGAIRHRGPDEFGVYCFRKRPLAVGLGSARLSIVDLLGGQQPIGNEDRSLWIVFNGEVFNCVELRAELADRGHRFTTRSDTEVVLHAFEQWGPQGFDRLNGQFAFAIWDENTEQLWLARDRCGVRPLFYTWQSGKLIFASEMKAILSHGGVAARFDPLALDQTFTFWSPLPPRTALEGIRTLPPGCWMSVNADGKVRVERYWRLEFPAAGQETSRGFQEAAGELRQLLEDAVRLRLRADVPVGAYLSGGLDSSVIAALVGRVSSNHLETFSIAFDDPAFDESHFQRQVAGFLGTRHHVVQCSYEDIGRVFPDVVWHCETPILRTAPAPMLLLSRLVRAHGFKVVLTGEGADEVLAGYDIFKEAKIRRFWARQPDSSWRPALLDRIYPDIGGLTNAAAVFRRAFFKRGLERSGLPGFSHELRWNNTSRIKRLFSKQLLASVDACDHPSDALRECGGHFLDALELPADFARWSPLAQAQCLEIKIFLAEYLLCSQGDRMAMAHSVEGRFPFLDHRVVAFCSQLPPSRKLHGLDEKHLLKRAVRDLVPEPIRQRVKRPYRAPITASFFPGGRQMDWMADALSPRALLDCGCFEPTVVAALVAKLRSSGTPSETDSMALAGVLSTQLFYQQFIAGYSAPASLDESDDIKYVVRGPDMPLPAAATNTG